MSTAGAIAPLVELGFTPLEAEVYAWLLEAAPATGYRVAQAIRRPAPNVYKALESLEAKGAILVDEGARRLCRALPPDEVLGHLERRFRERKRQAARALADLSVPAGDDRVWQLRSAEAVRERARAMLARAETVVLVDAFPGALAALRAELAATAARGVEVAVLAYEPAELDGVRIVLQPDGPETIGRWPGQWLSLVVDGTEHLLAFLSPDGEDVLQAVWTRSLYLSWVYHSAHAAEIILAAIESAAREGKDAVAVLRALESHDHLRAKHARGFHELRRRVDEQYRTEGETS